MKIAKLFCISILLGSCGASTPMKAVDTDMLVAVPLSLAGLAISVNSYYQEIKKQFIQIPEPTTPVAPITHKKQERLVKKTPESSTLLVLLLLLIMHQTN